MEAVGRRSTGQLLLCWLWLILGCGLLYWLLEAATGQGLRVGGKEVGAGMRGLGASIYFSFVTALSVGYGDIVPVGLARALAILEAAAGLLLFGSVISKLVSRRQEDLIEEIHLIAFEDRLGRVRGNLHLVLSELQAVASLCGDPGVPRARLLARAESVSGVFAGELRAVHDLLFRPQDAVDEETLGAILANLEAGLRELIDLLACLAAEPRSAALQSNLRGISALAGEICGDCVPREHAPALKIWMDRIQDHAGRVA